MPIIRPIKGAASERGWSASCIAALEARADPVRGTPRQSERSAFFFFPEQRDVWFQHVRMSRMSDGSVTEKKNCQTKTHCLAPYFGHIEDGAQLQTLPTFCKQPLQPSAKKTSG